MEMALLAPFMIAVMVAGIDFGGALLAKARVARVLAASAEYATLAGQNSVTWDTIETNAVSIASSVTSAFVGTPTVTAKINQRTGTGSDGAGTKCCLNNNTWTCSTSSTLTCSDGSTPGVYITVTAQYPIRTLFSGDAYLTGSTLTDKIVAPIK